MRLLLCLLRVLLCLLCLLVRWVLPCCWGCGITGWPALQPMQALLIQVLPAAVKGQPLRAAVSCTYLPCRCFPWCARCLLPAAKAQLCQPLLHAGQCFARWLALAVG